MTKSSFKAIFVVTLALSMLLGQAQQAPADCDKQNLWETINGYKATDIAVTPEGNVWIIGTDGSIHYWVEENYGFTKVGGWASRVDGGPNNQPWVLGGSGIPYQWNGKSWTKIGGMSNAVDIGVGKGGQVFVVKDNKLFKYTGNNAWEEVATPTNWHPAKVTVDNNGNPYVQRTDSYFMKLENGNWVYTNGAGKDLSFGPDGVMQVIGNNWASYKYNFPASNGYSITTGRNLIAIATGLGNNLWAVDNKNNVVRSSGLNWKITNNYIYQMGFALDGSLYGLTNTQYASGRQIMRYRYASNDFQAISTVQGANYVSGDADGNPIILDANNRLYRWADNTFVQYPEAHTHFGIGANGDIWSIGVKENGNGGRVIKQLQDDNTWKVVGGAAVRAAVGPDGTAWVVNALGNIFYRANDRWVQVSGAAQEISAGVDGSIYIIGTDSKLYKWIATTSAWYLVRDNADVVSVAVDKYGYPWISLTNNRAYQYNDQCKAYEWPADRVLSQTAQTVVKTEDNRPECAGTYWQDLPDDALDITVTPAGIPWIIKGDNSIAQWNEENWTWVTVGGWATRITGGSENKPWVIGGEGRIYQWNGNKWEQVPGMTGATDIAVSKTLDAYVVKGGEAYHYIPSSATWNKLVGSNIDKIAVDIDGTPFITYTNKHIYKWSNNQWVSFTGAGFDIDIGPDGTPHTVGTNRASYRYSYKNKRWEQTSGRNLATIAGNLAGEAYAITTSKVVVRQFSLDWAITSGSLTQIGLGRQGQLYGLGLNQLAQGSAVWKYRHSNNQWVQVSKYHGAVKVLSDNKGFPMILDKNNHLYQWTSDNTWEELPEAHTDFGVGVVNNELWTIGIRAISNSYEIKQLNSKGQFQVVNGAATKVAVGPDGTAWVINGNGNWYERSGNKWIQQDGQISDISIGADGSIYVKGTDNGLYKVNPSNKKLIKVHDNILSMAVDHYGHPWIVGTNKRVYQRKDYCQSYVFAEDANLVEEKPAPVQLKDSRPSCAKDSWELLPGKGSDITVTAEGDVWLIDTDQNIKHWNEQNFGWDDWAGKAVRISGNSNKDLWVVDVNGNLYKRNGKGWTKIGGLTAYDVGVSPEGDVWAIGRDNAVYHYIESSGNWNKVAGITTGSKIAVARDGQPWIIQTNSYIYKFENDKWVYAGTTAQDIDCGSDGMIHIAHTNKYNYYWSWESNKWTYGTARTATNIAGDIDGSEYIIDTNGQIYRQTGKAFKRLSGAATEIAVGADGSVFVLGTNKVTGGQGIWKYRHQAKNWDQVSKYHGAIQISADGNGNPYIVDENNQMYAWQNNVFVKLPGAGIDIAVNEEGDIWSIGAVEISTGGNAIRRYQNGRHIQTNGAAVKVAVQPNGKPWVINKNNNIYRRTGDGWTQYTGSFVDLDVGADGTLWAVGEDKLTYRFNEKTGQFIHVDGTKTASRIGVDKYGLAWMTESSKAIYQYIDTCIEQEWPIDKDLEEEQTPANPLQDTDRECALKNWELLAGAALDIAVTPEGQVWVIGTNEKIYYWNENKWSWTAVPGAAVRITGGTNNKPWVANSAGNVYRWKGDGWEQIGGVSAKDISVSVNGDVWAVGKEDNGVYHYQSGSKTWNQVAGKNADKICVDIQDTPYMVDTGRAIWKWSGNNWVRFSGAALDIDCAPDGDIQVIGTNRVNYKWSYARNSWQAGTGRNLYSIAGTDDDVTYMTDNNNAIWRQSSTKWVWLSRYGYDIAAGADGSIFLVSNNKVAGGYGVWRFQHQKRNWDQISKYHGATRVAVDGSGNPFIVDESNQIFRWVDGRFIQIEGAAQDIGVNEDGVAWIIGIDESIQRLNLKTGKFTKVNGAAVRIAVAKGGAPWVVNSAGNVYKRIGDSWTHYPGVSGQDISVGKENEVYVTSKDNTIYRFNDKTNQWNLVDGVAKTLAVDKYGLIWALQTNNGAYQLQDECATEQQWPVDTLLEEEKPTGNENTDNVPVCALKRWELLTGAALDIAVTENGGVWVIGTNQKIYQWNEKNFNWDAVSGAAVRIAGGPKNQPWVVNSGGNVYEWNGKGWNHIPGVDAIDIGVSPNGEVWVVGRDRIVYHYTEENKIWNSVETSASANRIAVDNHDVPFVVHTNGVIQKWASNKWENQPGRALDIAIGTDGTIKVIGTNRVDYTWSYAKKSWQAGTGRNLENIAVSPEGRTYFTEVTSNAIYRADSADWKRLSGAATEISIGAEGSLFVLGTNRVRGGQAIYKYIHERNQWNQISSYHGATRISADKNGNPYIVDESNHLWKWVGKRFEQLPGAAIDVAVGVNDKVWAIGVKENGSGGNTIKVLNGEKWRTITGAALKIAVQSNGRPWVINTNNNLFRWLGDKWEKQSLLAQDVACGPNGDVWVTGTDDKVYRWHQQTGAWVLVNGLAKQITVDKYGLPWITNAAKQIYQRLDDCGENEWPVHIEWKEDALVPLTYFDIEPDCPLNNWELLPGAALDLTVTPEGQVWVIGTNQAIFRWNEKNFVWDQMSGAALRIAGGPKNKPWVVNAAGNVYQWNGQGWTHRSGVTAYDVGVSSNGDVWVTGADKEVYHYLPEQDVWNKIDGNVQARNIAVTPDGIPFICGYNNYIYQWKDNQWERPIGGAAFDIDIDSAGTINVIGTNRASYRYSGKNKRWEIGNGRNMATIAGDSEGGLYMIDTNKQILRQSSIKFNQVSGAALDIAENNGVTYVVGTNRRIYQWDGSKWVIFGKLGSADRIAVDEGGNPWFVATNNQVYRWSHSANSFELVDGISATDIAIGRKGHVAFITNSPAAGGYTIQGLNNRGEMNTYPGSAVRIAVDKNGKPWVVNKNGNIYRWLGDKWEALSGQAQDIAISADNQVYITGTDNFLYRWYSRTSSWIKLNQAGKEITGDNQGWVWFVDASRRIYQTIEECPVDDEEMGGSGPIEQGEGVQNTDDEDEGGESNTPGGGYNPNPGVTECPEEGEIESGETFNPNESGENQGPTNNNGLNGMGDEEEEDGEESENGTNGSGEGSSGSNGEAGEEGGEVKPEIPLPEGGEVEPTIEGGENESGEGNESGETGINQGEEGNESGETGTGATGETNEGGETEGGETEGGETEGGEGKPDYHGDITEEITEEDEEEYKDEVQHTITQAGYELKITKDTPLATPENTIRSLEYEVEYPVPFEKDPRITVALGGFQILEAETVGLSVSVVSTTKTSFKYKVTVPAGAAIMVFKINYLATERTTMTFGKHSLDSLNYIDRAFPINGEEASRTLDAHVDTGLALKNARAFVGISGFSVDGTKGAFDFGVSLKQANSDSVDITYRAEGSTLVDSIDVVVIAYEETGFQNVLSHFDLPDGSDFSTGTGTRTFKKDQTMGPENRNHISFFAFDRLAMSTDEKMRIYETSDVTDNQVSIEYQTNYKSVVNHAGGVIFYAHN